MGIEPTSSAWKAEVLPLNYTRPVIHKTRSLKLLNHDTLYRQRFYQSFLQHLQHLICAFIRRAKILTVVSPELSRFHYQIVVWWRG